MKFLHRISLFILAVLAGVCAHAQQIPARVLFEGAEHAAAQSAVKGATDALARNAARSAVTPALTGHISTLPNTPVPLSFYETPANIKTTVANLDNLKQNVQTAVQSAADPWEDKILTPEQKNTLVELDRFIEQTGHFPEQYFDEDMSVFSRRQTFAMAEETALRQKIDKYVSLNPFSDFSKAIFTLHSKYAEKQIINLARNLKQISATATKKVSQLPKVENLPAYPILIASTELPNAYKLTKNFYRGAQPTEQGYRMLSKMGVKTIISFRTHKPNKELIESLGMQSVHIPLNPALITPEQMARFLRVVADPDHQPVFVHCRHGSDRTGAMVAVYRMVIQKWAQRDALTEMKNPRFGFHPIFFTLPPVVRHIDVRSLESALPK